MLRSLYLAVVFLLLMIFVIVGVAFLSLLDRKVLGYIHIPKGPNTVGFVGIFQPSERLLCCSLDSKIFLCFLTM